MSYPVYSETHESGVAWIGPKPKHWQVRRLKDIGRLIGGAAFPLDEQGMVDEELPFYKVGDLKAAADGRNMGDAPHTISRATADRLGASVIPKNSVVYAKIGAALLLNRRRVTSVACCIDNNMTAYLPDDTHLDIRWVFHWLSNIDFAEFMNPGAVPSFSEGYQSLLPICVPSREEQQQIAAFLDWKTRQIDALIAKKQTLLQKLKEKRLAVITQAVTKGLNPDAPLRDSGIAWLGEVPTHWDVKRLKFVARIGNGSTPNREDPAYWDGGTYPWLNSSVVNQEQVTHADQFVTPLALAECHLPCIAPPAVLVGITGQGKTRGMATTLLFEATINQHLAYVKPDDTKAIVGFLRRVFDMAYAHLRSESENGGSTKGAITCEQIAELPIPVPPLDEQKFISERIDLGLAKLARMSDNAESAITRLTEYRSALITAATTGKIDVRNVAIPAHA